MQERHSNRLQYFNEQALTTKEFVIPYIEKHVKITSNLNVLEIGCGEGGNLMPFVDIGCNSIGVDLSEGKISKGIEYYADHPNLDKIILICKNIYEWETNEKFDLIILRDVIEHIPNQQRFMGILKNVLHEDGIVFFGFPPWQNPFGGHQQICRNRFLSILPWFHLFPMFFYKGVLGLFGETKGRINDLVEIKETGISIEKFEKILRIQKYSIVEKTLFLINPNYETKFNLQPRKQINIISKIPWIRNVFTTAVYYLVKADDI